MPKRVAIACAIGLACTAAQAQSPGSQQDGAIPYTSVAEALAALKAKPGVKFDVEGGWTMAKDTDGANWSFTPSNHYAHPSVGRRTLEQDQGRFFVKTQILCQASKSACDRLNQDYQLLNQRMNEAIQREQQKKK